MPHSLNNTPRSSRFASGSQTLSLSAGRKLVLASFTKAVDFELARPFVVLLPADNAADCELAGEIISALIARGCVEVCCVGTFAEKMHDQLDVIIENAGDVEVVTTSFGDTGDACEYFLFAASAGGSSLLALVLDRPGLLADLKRITGL